MASLQAQRGVAASSHRSTSNVKLSVPSFGQALQGTPATAGVSTRGRASRGVPARYFARRSVRHRPCQSMHHVTPLGIGLDAGRAALLRLRRLLRLRSCAMSRLPRRAPAVCCVSVGGRYRGDARPQSVATCVKRYVGDVRRSTKQAVANIAALGGAIVRALDGAQLYRYAACQGLRRQVAVAGSSGRPVGLELRWTRSTIKDAIHASLALSLSCNNRVSS